MDVKILGDLQEQLIESFKDGLSIAVIYCKKSLRNKIKRILVESM